MNLQDKLYNDLNNGAEVGRDFSLEDGLLIYSGADTENKLKEYKSKLNKIHADFRRYYERQNNNNNNNILYHVEIEKRADLLNQFIGFDKFKRYLSSQNNLIKAIDNGLSKNMQMRIGNCSALSKLYAVLGLKEKFNLKAVYSDYNNSHSNHVFLKLISGKNDLPVETTMQNGFNSIRDYKNLMEFPVEKLFQLNLLEFADNLSLAQGEKYFKLLEKMDFFHYSLLYGNWAAANIFENKPIEAKKLYELSLKLNKENCPSKIGLAESLIKLGEFNRAKIHLNFAINKGDSEVVEIAKSLYEKIYSEEEKICIAKYSPDVANPEDFCEFGF